MLQFIMDMVRGWHETAQAICLIVISGMLTLIVMAIWGGVAEFFNQTLPLLVRGYPSEKKEENAQEDES
jgi:phosphate/sulfate permease